MDVAAGHSGNAMLAFMQYFSARLSPEKRNPGRLDRRSYRPGMSLSRILQA